MIKQKKKKEGESGLVCIAEWNSTITNQDYYCLIMQVQWHYKKTSILTQLFFIALFDISILSYQQAHNL